MEQTTQQIIQKTPFPIKTKIAAWWMIVVGLFGLYLFPWHINKEVDISREIGFSSLYLVFLIPSFFLLKKKRWSWWICIILSGGISFYFFSRLFTLTMFLVGLSIFDFYYLLPFLAPFILLLLDRKKFFKIAS